MVKGEIPKGFVLGSSLRKSTKLLLNLALKQLKIKNKVIICDLAKQLDRDVDNIQTSIRRLVSKGYLKSSIRIVKYAST